MSNPKDPIDDLNPEENLRMDNQIKRLELEMKGAKFIEHNPEGIELPAEVEAQMLDQILQFEKMKNQAKEIQIFEFLGKPSFKSLVDLKAEEVKSQKDKLLKLMSKKGIILGSMAPVADEEMYRFITEEFMNKMLLDIPVKGFIRHFIYEEYYPNDKLNIEKTIQFFLEAYLLKDEDMPMPYFCHKSILDYLNEFSNLYERFSLKKIEFISIVNKKTTGIATIDIAFDSFIENSRKSHLYAGEIQVKVKKVKGFWQIIELQFPKIA